MQHRILFVLTPAFNPTNGGVQNTTFKLGREFSQRGHEVYYYSYEPAGHIDVEYGVLFHANEKGGSLTEKNNALLSEYILQLSPDVVINQMPYEVGIQRAIQEAKKGHQFLALGCLRNSLFSVVNNLATYAKKSLPKPLGFLSGSKMLHKILLPRHKKRHATSLRGILKNHDYFVLLVPTNVEEIEYFLPGFDRTKTFAVPNSIPSVHTDFSKKEKVILHVGRLDFSQKRSDLIVPFWEKLHNLLPDWTFEIVGYGEYESVIQDQLKTKNLPRVKFFGKQKPDSYFKRASIFMMPSAYEGFPNTLLEAQSFGCVPFCFDSYPAVQWIVEDGKDCFLLPPFDVDAMVNKVAAIALNEEKIEYHRTLAIQNAKRFVIQEVGDQWEAKFKELIKK